MIIDSANPNSLGIMGMESTIVDSTQAVAASADLSIDDGQVGDHTIIIGGGSGTSINIPGSARE